MEQRQLTCMIHVLHLRCLNGAPPPTPSRHTCDSESNYLPLANLLISHTFPIMVRTFPAFHKQRSIMYQARSHRKKINHKPTQISLLCAGYAGSMKVHLAYLYLTTNSHGSQFKPCSNCYTEVGKIPGKAQLLSPTKMHNTNV